MPQHLHVLYEHASGYGLFEVREVEDIGALLPEVEKAINDASLFRSVVKLVAFSPFKSGTNALDNINSVSEGVIHEDLKLFLETNLPTGKKAKKSGVILGVGDNRISGTLQEDMGIKCAGGDCVHEIIRGLRKFFSGMVKGLSPIGEAKAQLGLGHSYSRAKVKFNVHRADNMIIQSIALLDQLDKDVNTFSMRIREWYSYHFPELLNIIKDNYMYCKLVKYISNRKKLREQEAECLEKIEEITMDSGKAKAIVEASKMSMGMDVSIIDMINIESFATRVVSLSEYRKCLIEYLHKRMHSVAPNLSSLIGDVVGARLISHAGSLTNLAKYPASTVQILGAEKALFRALKTRGNTPKYGLIFHSTFISKASAKNKGRISRYLANKCSIASRIDCFTEIPNTIFGEKLKEQVEERLQFFLTGETPRKNIDVMHNAISEVGTYLEAHKKEVQTLAITDTSTTKKKKKKKRKSEANQDLSQVISDDETPAKQAKIVEIEEPLSNGNGIHSNGVESSGKKKKKKKQKNGQAEESMVSESNVTIEEPAKKKKKSKNNESEVMDTTVNTTMDESLNTSGKKKKKKKKATAE